MIVKPRHERNQCVKVVHKHKSDEFTELKSKFSNTKILAIENNSSHLDYYGSIFPNCTLCKTPSEALRLARMDKFDVVILDYFFRSQNGFELVNLIKQNPVNANIVSLLITNYESGLPYSTLNLFDSYIFRPAKPIEIYEKIQTLL